MGLKDRKCPNGHTYEVLDYGGVVSVVAKGDDCLELTCPECGSPEFEEHLGTISGRPHGAGYPFFDVGLGAMVYSAQHQRELARSKGAEAVDYHDMMRELDAQRAKIETEKEIRRKRYAETVARQEADPGIRKAKAIIAEETARLGTKRFIEQLEGGGK